MASLSHINSILLKHSLKICKSFSRSLKTATIGNNDMPCTATGGAIVTGVYNSDSDPMGQSAKLTPTGTKLNERVQGKIMELLRNAASPLPKLGQTRVFFGLDPLFPVIAVTGLGGICQSYNTVEILDEKKESIRIATAAGVQAIQHLNFQTIFIDSMEHAESAAEGSSLGVWLYQELRNHIHQEKVPRLQLFDSCDFAGWRIGLVKASAQNLARQLQETPRNLLTPSIFAQTAVEILSKAGICVEVRMKNWAKLRNLNAFLAAAKGSCEPPVFLETLYEGCDPDVCPIVLIGKGTTFNSGGLCLKKQKQLKHMRGDMSGAACIVATLKAVAALQLPVNIRALIPLCENSVGAMSYKPGDVYSAINSKTIMIEDTEIEGVLMLADTLHYSKELKPKFILDVGTITPEIETGIGAAACGVYSNNDSLFETMRIASIHTGDRVWRMPLWKYFSEYVRKAEFSDLTNRKYPKHIGGPGKAVAFLHEFLPKGIDWIHMDSYGISKTNGDDYKYLRKGMSGRPTRTLIEFIAQLCCQIEQNKK